MKTDTKIPKRLKIERSTATINGLGAVLQLTRRTLAFEFRLPPKCMTLNDLSARLKVIDSLIAAEVAKYSLLMTPTPCRPTVL